MLKLRQLGKLSSLVRKSYARCPYSHRTLHNKESENQKDFVAKNLNPSADNNSSSGKKSQSDQALDRSPKKDFHLNKGGQQGQSSNNIPTTAVNATAVQKDKRKGKKDLSQVECYTCHKKGYYVNNYPNKEKKNECQSQ